MNLDEIKDLIKVFDDSTLSKLELQVEDVELKLEKGSIHSASTPVIKKSEHPLEYADRVEESSQNIEEGTRYDGEYISSPMVGTYYSSPSPDSASYVKVGDEIRRGQIVAIVEAMKIMNELEAEFDCKVLEIIPENGQPLEYGAPIFKVERK